MSIIDLDAPTPAGDPHGTDGQDLALWVKSDTGHTQVNMNGTNSGTWFDNSYSGNLGIFSSGIFQTTTTVGDLNYNESIRTQLNSYVSFERNAQDNMTIAIVMATEHSGVGQPFSQQGAILGGFDTGAGNEYYITMDGGDIFWVIDDGGTQDVAQSSSGIYNDGHAHVIIADRNAITGNISLTVDGTPIQTTGSTNFNTLGNGSMDSLRIGIHPSNTGQIDARYGEVLVYDTVFTGTDRDQLETYLALKFGITLDHDYLDPAGGVIFTQSGYPNRIFGVANEDYNGALFDQNVSGSQGDSTLTIFMVGGHNDSIPVSNVANNTNALAAG